MILSRRTFIATGGAALTAAPMLILPQKSIAQGLFLSASKSRVVVARKAGVLQPPKQVDPASIRLLLDEASKALTGRPDPLALWRGLFTASDVVGIKVNTLGGRMLSPSPELVLAVAERLVQAGVPPNNILIWDRSERELKAAGFTPDVFTGKARVLATDTSGVGYEPQPEISGSIGSCFSRLISRYSTALINLGVLKDHDLSGVSVAMKNLFGLIHNPNRYHFDVYKDPYLPDLCLHPYVKNKLRLNLCDALLAQYDGGPAYKASSSWEFGGILLSTDPVAIDSVAARLLESKRREMKLPSFKEAEREPLYLALAEERKIGFADPSRIDLLEIEA